jgi:hypothetical protein
MKVSVSGMWHRAVSYVCIEVSEKLMLPPYRAVIFLVVTVRTSNPTSNQFWPSIHSQPIYDTATDVPTWWLHKVTTLTTLVVSAQPAAGPIRCREWDGKMTRHFLSEFCEIPPVRPERVEREVQEMALVICLEVAHHSYSVYWQKESSQLPFFQPALHVWAAAPTTVFTSYSIKFLYLPECTVTNFRWPLK